MSEPETTPGGRVARGASSRLLRLACAVLAATTLSGCACRSKAAWRGDSTNLWNRNAVVAYPTFAGNIVGTALGVPPMYLAFGVLWLTVRSPEAYRDAGDRTMSVMLWSMAYARGAVFGAPFIPVSLLFPDNPEYCWAD